MASSYNEIKSVILVYKLDNDFPYLVSGNSVGATARATAQAAEVTQ